MNTFLTILAYDFEGKSPSRKDFHNLGCSTLMNTTKIIEGATVKITKGCKARDIDKGRALVVSVKEMGPEYSHTVRIVLGYKGRNVAFYARHINRLSDAEVNLNDGNPSHTIKVRA